MRLLDVEKQLSGARGYRDQNALQAGCLLSQPVPETLLSAKATTISKRDIFAVRLLRGEGDIVKRYQVTHAGGTLACYSEFKCIVPGRWEVNVAYIKHFVNS